MKKWTTLTTIFSPEKSKTFIRVPQRIAKDSRFPFDDNERVLMTVDVENGRIVVQKIGPDVEGSPVESDEASSKRKDRKSSRARQNPRKE